MAALPQPWKLFSDRIYKIEESIRRLQNSSPFSGTGLSIPEDGTTQVDGNLLVLGDFTAEGKVNNDALTDPVIPGSVWVATTAFSVAVAWSTVASQTVTVPDGCTRLEADARARVTAFYNNVGTGIDYLYARLTVGGLSSGFYPLAVSDNGGSGTNHVFRSVLLTGLTPGSTVSITLEGSTGFNSWAGPTTNNEAQIGASLRWLR